MKLNTAAAVLVLMAGGAAAQTLDDLKKDGANTDNVLTYGMGYGQQVYSPLKQVDKSSVKRLVPVWNLSLDNPTGEHAQPLIYNGVMYVTDAKATVAIDVATGKQIWKTPVDWLPETPRVVCCGVSNKGAAIYDGKLYRTTLDAYVVALDQKTGKQIWKQKAAEWQDGYSMTVAPLVADGVVITGISGAEFGIRGFIDGWDAETGTHLWRRYTIPARGEPGNETWPQDTDAWQHGGGSGWITGSYDPDLDLTYWGTGNPAPWASQTRPGDNLYASSVLALRPKTGEVVWHYQFTPGDQYDYDSVGGLAVAVHARRQELAARGVQSRDRPALRQHHASGRHLSPHRGEALGGGPALSVRREPGGAAAARRGARPRGRDRSLDRQAALARPADGSSAMVGDAGDRRRIAVHRQGDRRVHRARCRDRQDAVAVPDRLGRQCHADHLHAERPAIRHGAVGPGRALPEHQPPAARQRAAGRIGVDLRADAGSAVV